MIKMIASDIDGTLLQNGETAIRPELFPLIERLLEKGIYFCAASGRQYPCLLRLFAPVADRIHYICENGTLTFAPDGTAISKEPIPREDAMEMIDSILKMDRCEVLISGERTCYILPKEEDFLPHMRDFVGNDTTVIASPDEITEEIVKIAAYCRKGPDAVLASLKGRWGEQYSIALGGTLWVDVTRSNKAIGLQAMCEKLAIDPSEVMAFGDNFNDVEMLRLAGVSYAMEHSHPEVKAQAKHICKRVEPELEKFLLEVDG